MAIAKGSRSSIIWKEEETFGVAPPVDDHYNQLPLNSETMDENINTIQGEDIRADRANPGLRGANIATGGQVVHDFGGLRTITLLEHMLAATRETVALPDAPVALAGATDYVRGQYVLGVTNNIYVCLRGGKTAAGVLPALLDAPSGQIEVPYNATNPNNRPDLLFEYAHLHDTDLFLTSLIPRVEPLNPGFQPEGLTFEKRIRGGDTDLYVQFRGGRVNTLDLTVPQEGIVKATYGMLFKESEKALATLDDTPHLQAEDPFAGYDAFLHLNDAALVGNLPHAHKEFSMTFTNSVDESVYCIGSRFRTDLPEGVRRPTGRLSEYFLNETAYDYFKNETEVTMDMTFVHYGIFVHFQFPEVKLTGSGTPKISGQGVMMADYDWTAFKQDSPLETDIAIYIVSPLGDLAIRD